MTAARVEAASTVPQPLAINGVVVIDLPARTLYVRLPDHLTGPGRVAWAKGYAALQQADAGYQSQVPSLWASTKSADKVARGAAGEAGMVKFFFPIGGGNTAFSELVGKPGLYAIVTCDRATGYFMRCLFLHRTA